MDVDESGNFHIAANNSLTLYSFIKIFSVHLMRFAMFSSQIGSNKSDQFNLIEQFLRL